MIYSVLYLIQHIKLTAALFKGQKQRVNAQINAH